MDRLQLLKLLGDAETALRNVRTEVERLHPAEPRDPFDDPYDAMGDRIITRRSPKE